MDGAGSPRLHVADLLRKVADEATTGCLEIRSPDGAAGEVWLRGGRVYSVRVPGFRPMIGVRLLSSGRIGPDQLAEALEVQRTELPSWRIGDILVHLGFVSREEVDAFVLEQLRDQTADLLGWEIAAHGMLPEATTREDVAPPVDVEDLLAHARERLIRWAAVLEVIGGADAVPVLATRDVGTADVVLGPHDWALLCKVDGTRTLADLARECGFTLHEAGQFVQALVGAGLLEIEIPGVPARPRWFQGGTDWVGTDLPDMDDSMARVTAALAELLATHPTMPRDEAVPEPVAVAVGAAPAGARTVAEGPAPAGPEDSPTGSVLTALVVAAPVDVAPVSVAPVDAAPVDAASVSVAPVDAAPLDAATVDAAPLDAGTVDAAPTHAALTHADLIDADLTHADLIDADLTHADLTHARERALAADDAAARGATGIPSAPQAPEHTPPPPGPGQGPWTSVPPAPDQAPWTSAGSVPAASTPAAPAITPQEAAAALTEWVRDSPVQPVARPEPVATVPAAQAPTSPAAQAPTSPAGPAAAQPAAAPPARLDPVDAAALMRELSSLSGGGEDPAAAMRAAGAPRPAAGPPVEHHKKKRHGLFGR